MITATAVYALTEQGAELARRLAAEYGGLVCVPERMARSGEQGFRTLRDCVAESFSRFSRHIFITAAGIAVRCIAPHLRDKGSDPAVVVLDQAGKHVISLVSGHLGGANDLARSVACSTGGTAIITTATDTAGLPSLDIVAMEAGCAIHNLAAVRHVNGALLAEESVSVYDPADLLRLRQSTHAERFRFVETPWEALGDGPAVLVTWRDALLFSPGEQTLVLHPPVLRLGIGCRKGRSVSAIETFVRRELGTRMIALASVAEIVSVEAKAEEPGLLAAARALGKSIRFFPAETLARVTVPNPSEAPQRAVGTRSVAEASALSAAAEQGPARLVQEKCKDSGTTLAVALSVPFLSSASLTTLATEGRQQHL